jgi:3-oxoacyl-[acyl-carrier protein] reductase
MARDYNFKNQVAIVTGGGSGIGQSVAVAFAKAGARVAILGRDIKKLTESQKQIQEHNLCAIYRANVSNPITVQKTIRKIYKQFKRIDVVVNGAGLYGPIGQFHTNDLTSWHGAIAVNLLGTVNVCHAALPLMLKQKHGKIINFSGGGAVQPFANFSAYSTSKAAVVRFSENIAKEYERDNIQINVIAPGAINTAVLDQVLKTGIKKVGKEFYEKSLEQKRTGGDNVETAAELVLFLCSPHSHNLTGKLISAKWDRWQNWNRKSIEKIKKSSLYTIRRIDNKYFRQA